MDESLINDFLSLSCFGWLKLKERKAPVVLGWRRGISGDVVDRSGLPFLYASVVMMIWTATRERDQGRIVRSG